MPKNSFKEAFLHFIWQHQYFDKKNFVTTEGESIQVLSTGFLNKDAGPDFYNCRILINKIEWHGTIEVHYKTSDWNRHNHANDKAYNNVVLHLVWEQDINIKRHDGSYIPTLELKNRVDYKIIEGYQSLLNSPNKIPCDRSIGNVDNLFILSMLERCLVERMENKANDVLILQKRNNSNWEETCYQWLGKCFGFKINSEPFQRLCTLLPYSILKKHLSNSLQTEALLFGIAGFLEGANEEKYFTDLKKEFLFLSQKYLLKSPMEISEWKFLRLRPANFPSIRIAQFAAFLLSTENLFDSIFNNQSEFFKIKLASKPNSFWHSHFHFGNTSKSKHQATLGKNSIENIIINAIVPLRFSYGISQDQDQIKDDCLDLLRQLSPEKNHILNIFSDLKLPIPSAFESQAYLQLHNTYCVKKECLSCTIGHQIIHPKRH